MGRLPEALQHRRFTILSRSSFNRLKKQFNHLIQGRMKELLSHLEKFRFGDSLVRQSSIALKTAFDSILPLRCCLCMQPDQNGFCHQCQLLLPWLGCACLKCGAALPSEGICGKCQTKPAGIQSATIPFRYIDPISHQIHSLKYQRKLTVAPALGKMLAIQVIKNMSRLPDALLPVPLHINRIKQRGFNQAGLIAESTGKLLGIPVDYGIICRTKDTVSQTSLDQGARAKNMLEAFAVHVNGRYDAVAVIDDVITSGATINAICTELRLNGYNNISAWAIAKT